MPTLEEAMSLMEPTKTAGRHINGHFGGTWLIWTSDEYDASVAWVVSFVTGWCYSYHVNSSYYVRAVR